MAVAYSIKLAGCVKLYCYKPRTGEASTNVCVKLYFHAQRVEIGRLIGLFVSNFIVCPQDGSCLQTEVRLRFLPVEGGHRGPDVDDVPFSIDPVPEATPGSRPPADCQFLITL